MVSQDYTDVRDQRESRGETDLQETRVSEALLDCPAAARDLLDLLVHLDPEDILDQLDRKEKMAILVCTLKFVLKIILHVNIKISAVRYSQYRIGENTIHNRN